MLARGVSRLPSSLLLRLRRRCSVVDGFGVEEYEQVIQQTQNGRWKHLLYWRGTITRLVKFLLDNPKVHSIKNRAPSERHHHGAVDAGTPVSLVPNQC